MTPFLVSALMVIASSFAYAQLDSSTLHFKYGTPLDRETFTVRPGIQMVVDYGVGKLVCRIQLPSGMRMGGEIPADAVTRDRVQAVLAEMVPISIRGKEVRKGTVHMGLQSVSIEEYEHLTISESKNGDRETGITVTFNDANCPFPQAAGVK